jgi:thiol-disulfide isomerase/thioredoxin
MTRRTIVIGSLIAGLAPAAYPQAATQPAPQTAAAQCQLDASAYQSKKFAEMRAAGQTLTAATVAPVSAEAKRIARECAGKIALESASPSELVAITSLYLFTNDTAKATAASTLALARPNMSELERAGALVAGEQMAIAAFDPFAGINPDAERFVREVDVLSDGALAQKVRAHQLLLGRYDYADIDDGVRDHARKLLALAERALATNALGMTQARAGVPAVNAAYPVMASAYSSIARGQGDFLHADSALLVLDAAYRVLEGAFPDAHRYLDGQREMYRLVGTRATPIDGKWWINAEDGSTLVPGAGKVTLIQFTAHWCVPCKKSYPGMLAMMTHFAGKPVESVMESYLYGYFGAKRPLTPEQEVAEDRDYYTKEHGLPFKIAINPLPARGDTLSKDTERRYAVGGIPQIVVVDRKGVIRAMVVGWDKGNAQRLTGLIDRLLAER